MRRPLIRSRREQLLLECVGLRRELAESRAAAARAQRGMAALQEAARQLDRDAEGARDRAQRLEGELETACAATAKARSGAETRRSTSRSSADSCPERTIASLTPSTASASARVGGMALSSGRQGLYVCFAVHRTTLQRFLAFSSRSSWMEWR